MQFVKSNSNINFIGKKNLAITISTIMLVISIASVIFHHGLNYGVDFAGGTLIQVKFKLPISVNQIKSKLFSTEFDTSTIQSFGKKEDNEFLVRTNKIIAKTHLQERIKTVFDSKEMTDVEVRRIEIVGPQVGKDLRERALFAMFYALLLISVYISGRFELKWTLSCIMACSLMISVYFLSLLGISVPILIIVAVIVTLLIFWFMKLKYAMGATVALIHDVIITIGVFSILNKEFSLSTVAALLTTVGYSLNDTIIVFDRIRENLRKNKSNQFPIIVNKSINETLGRTVLTSLTTLMVVLTLLLLGGGIIHDFAFALVIGVVVGTYSSIYVASPILLAWQKRKT